MLRHLRALFVNVMEGEVVGARAAAGRICWSVDVHTCTHVYMYTNVYAYTGVDVCIDICMRMCVHAQVYGCLCTYD